MCRRLRIVKAAPSTAVPELSTFWSGDLFGRLSKPFCVKMLTCEPVSYKKSIALPQVFILIIVRGAGLTSSRIAPVSDLLSGQNFEMCPVF